jgi:methylated-DNA-protein-cysteine methyltransferase-like protein
MHSADDGVPWQRVINSQGKISTDRLTLPHSLQQSILESEGVVFNKGKCDLGMYQWHPEGYEPKPDGQTKLFG